MTQALEWLAGVDWAGPAPRAALLVVLFAAVTVLAWVVAQLEAGIFTRSAEMSPKVPMESLLEFSCEPGGLLGHKLVQYSLQACRTNDGKIVLTALEGDQRIMFCLTDNDRDHLCAALQAL